MEALKKRWPGTPVPFLGRDVGEDNLSILPAGVSASEGVHPVKGLGSPGCPRSAGCLALGFLESRNVEVVEVWGLVLLGRRKRARQTGRQEREGGQHLAQARQRPVSGEPGFISLWSRELPLSAGAARLSWFSSAGASQTRRRVGPAETRPGPDGEVDQLPKRRHACPGEGSSSLAPVLKTSPPLHYMGRRLPLILRGSGVFLLKG